MLKNEETFCTVQHKIVRELGAWEAVVYATIANLLRKTDGYGNVANQTLIDLIGKDKKSIYRWIDKLIEAGYIEKIGGKGRGNISIYYITKKGGKMTPFIGGKKRGQNDPEKGANMTEKGGDMPPINKDINKESGSETRVPVDVPASLTTLSETHHPTFLGNLITTHYTPQNTTEDMNADFEEFWQLFGADKEFAHEKNNARCVFYQDMSEEYRQKILQQLRHHQRWRVRENDNPYWYLKNYNGEVVKAELPFVRQGTAKFENWCRKNIVKNKRMCLLRYNGSLTWCLYSDLQTMVDAGATIINDNWK